MTQGFAKEYSLKTDHAHMIKTELQSSGEKMGFAVCGIKTPGYIYSWGQNISFDILTLQHTQKPILAGLQINVKGKMVKIL